MVSIYFTFEDARKVTWPGLFGKVQLLNTDDKTGKLCQLTKKKFFKGDHSPIAKMSFSGRNLLVLTWPSQSITNQS